MRFVYLALILSLLPLASYAAGWTEELTVTGILTEGPTDTIGIYVAETTIYTTGCAPGAWIFIADTEGRRSRVFSILLTAAASGKKIKLWYTESCASWSWHGATSIILVP